MSRGDEKRETVKPVSAKRGAAKQVIGFIVAQLIITLICSALLLLIDWTAAYSGLTGGLIATVASAWFAYRVFARAQGKDAALVLRSMYWGEINKIVFTGAMFIAAFVLIRPVNGAALLAVFFLVHMTPVVVDLYKQPRRRREN